MMDVLQRSVCWNGILQTMVHIWWKSKNLHALTPMPSIQIVGLMTLESVIKWFKIPQFALWHGNKVKRRLVYDVKWTERKLVNWPGKLWEQCISLPGRCNHCSEHESIEMECMLHWPKSTASQRGKKLWRWTFSFPSRECMNCVTCSRKCMKYSINEILWCPQFSTCVALMKEQCSTALTCAWWDHNPPFLRIPDT